MKRYLRLAALAVTAVMLLGALASCGQIQIPDFVDEMMNFEYTILDFDESQATIGSSKNEEESGDGTYESELGEGESESIDHPWEEPTESDPFQEPVSPEPEEPSEEQGYRERILLVTDFHYVKDWYGIEDDERMRRMIGHINDEHKKDPLSMIIFMGDYSLDHWGYDDKNNPVTYPNTGESNTQLFMDKYRSQLPDVPMFWLAGNHEQFGNNTWKKMVGNARQGYAAIEDYLIVMWDSYGADLDPYYGHDGTYTPIDTEWVRKLMNTHPDKKVILVSHYFNSNQELNNSAELISDDRVVALFVGHEHHSDVQTLEGEFGYKKLIFAGNYSYYNDIVGDPYPYYWGFRDLVLTHDKVSSDYIIPENTIIVKGESVTVEAHIRDSWNHRTKWD